MRRVRGHPLHDSTTRSLSLFLFHVHTAPGTGGSAAGDTPTWVRRHPMALSSSPSEVPRYDHGTPPV